MVKTIVIIVVVLPAVLLIYAATRPDTFRVQRATSIMAPPEKIFAFINDFHSWGAWSPYEGRCRSCTSRASSGCTTRGPTRWAC
jgi:hypothetical protein